MTCLEALEYISRALDNDLNEEEKAELEKHIDECDSCRKEYEDMKAIYIDIRNEKQYDLPPSFHDDLMKKINDSKIVPFKTTAKKTYYKKYAALAASFLVLAVVGISSKDMLGVRGNGAAAPMAMPSASVEMDMAVAEECAPAEPAAAAPMEEAPRMMMAEAEIETAVNGAGYEQEPMEDVKFTMTNSADEDGVTLESAEEEMAAYNGDMINIIVLDAEDEEAVFRALEEYAQENGFDVGIGGNKISIYADRDISAEVKEIIDPMAQIAEDDAVMGTEYNVVEIEIR